MNGLGLTKNSLKCLHLFCVHWRLMLGALGTGLMAAISGRSAWSTLLGRLAWSLTPRGQSQARLQGQGLLCALLSALVPLTRPRQDTLPPVLDFQYGVCRIIFNLYPFKKENSGLIIWHKHLSFRKRLSERWLIQWKYIGNFWGVIYWNWTLSDS